MPYLGAEPTAHHGLNVFKYVATSSQTTFTGADAGGATLSYDVGDGSCQVWLNGVRLDSADITATNGTSVVLAACTTGDIIHIQAVKALTVGDVVPKAAGGTFDGAVVIGAGATVPSGQTLTIASGATIANSGTATGFSASTLAAATTVGTGAAEDTKIVFDGNAQDYYMGLDDTDDDLKIGLGSAVGTTAHMVFTEDGEITKPLQPAFHANGSSTQSNIATDTAVDIAFGTERFDIGGNFASNVFTAPVTGKYYLCTDLYSQSMDSAATTYNIQMKTSNQTYYNVFNILGFDTNGDSSMRISGLFDMDASDTASVVVYQAGGSAIADINAASYFCGYLAT